MNAPAGDAYSACEARFARIGRLQDAIEVLHWDCSTMMPTGGATARAEQVATLGLVVHQDLSDPALCDLLARAEAMTGLDSWQRANLAEMRTRITHATALPPDLVEARSRITSRCEMAWRDARPRNDFAALAPLLAEVVAVTRDVAAAKGAALGLDPYDALLDQYEPGLRAAEIDPRFAELERSLPGLLDAALDCQAARPAPVRPEGPFPVEAQRRLAIALMRAVGLDEDHSRLDTSAHPFSSGVPDDVRITTRYDTADFLPAVMAVLHESGHALYERGLPAKWRAQPVGRARGMSLHESQSLLLEMQVGCSRPFLDFAAPIMRDMLGGRGPAWEPENLYRLVTGVARSLIRVEADEVSYPLHVILRYGLERQLIAGRLSVADLRDAWNQGMARLLGVTPPDDRDGVMQDAHWPGGDFGYFPTYTLGAMCAAQIFAAATSADASILPGIGQGDFKPLYGWLGTHVHGLASSASTSAILTQATGRPLESAAFKAHLERRYLA
ncbi:MAG: carboxypeptidase M32 [Alphaproteobacteria bacterium]